MTEIAIHDKIPEMQGIKRPSRGLYENHKLKAVSQRRAKIRKVIYTTNTIEAINRQIRKIIKNKGVFPDDKSILK